MTRKLKAVIFGAIGAVAETSDLQRQAFNIAFKDAGLQWRWTPTAYRRLLEINGGQARLRAFRDADPSRAKISDQMIEKLHTAKEIGFVQLVGKSPLHPRPGVQELMKGCSAAGVQIAWCTSTSMENVKAIMLALGDRLPLEALASIVTVERIAAVKPAPDAYLQCLMDLGLTAGDVVAVEDTAVSIAAAKAAGIFVVATPGETTSGQDFTAADLVVTNLSDVTLESLEQLVMGSR